MNVKTLLPVLTVFLTVAPLSDLEAQQLRGPTDPIRIGDWTLWEESHVLGALEVREVVAMTASIVRVQDAGFLPVGLQIRVSEIRGASGRPPAISVVLEDLAEILGFPLLADGSHRVTTMTGQLRLGDGVPELMEVLLYAHHLVITDDERLREIYRAIQAQRRIELQFRRLGQTHSFVFTRFSGFAEVLEALPPFDM
jgi:hypothetical protein